MSVSTPGNKTVADDDGSIEEQLTAFVEATSEALERTEAPEESVKAVETAGEALIEAVENATILTRRESPAVHGAEDVTVEEDDEQSEDGNLREQVEDNADEIEQLETLVHTQIEKRKDLDSRLEAVEREDHDSHDEDADEDRVTPETPLEKIAALPEEMIEDESANVRRAMFVARNVKQYTSKVPAGRVIKSSELKRVLVAGTDCSGHYETVRRVMDVLNEFGKDQVVLDDRRDERKVVFKDGLSDRLEAIAGDDHRAGTTHTVVSGAGA